VSGDDSGRGPDNPGRHDNARPASSGSSVREAPAVELDRRCLGPDLGTACGAYGHRTLVRAAANGQCCVLAVEVGDLP
jgi:hypothetical protein